MDKSLPLPVALAIGELNAWTQDNAAAPPTGSPGGPMLNDNEDE